MAAIFDSCFRLSYCPESNSPKIYLASLSSAYKKLIADDFYGIRFVARLIQINAYGHVNVLEKISDDFNLHTKNSSRQNIETVKFFWGNGDIVQAIDEVAERFRVACFIE